MAAVATFNYFHHEKRWRGQAYASSSVSREPSRAQANPLRADSGHPLMTTTTTMKNLFSLAVGTHLIPHPSKVDKGGEDAFLVSSHNGRVIAVADGVSGWAEQNVDPSLFSMELMANALSHVADYEVNFDPQMLLKKAHAATTPVGSATITIAMLQTDGVLKIANLGDCGQKVIRQEHYFDCPFQLSSEIVGQTFQDAVISNVQLMEKDIIVMGSDGLFDNVLIRKSLQQWLNAVMLQRLAIAELARPHSMDLAFDSPYSMKARSRGFDVPLWKKIVGIRLTAGELDDITVMAGRVVKTQNLLHGMTDLD